MCMYTAGGQKFGLLASGGIPTLHSRASSHHFAGMSIQVFLQQKHPSQKVCLLSCLAHASPKFNVESCVFMLGYKIGCLLCRPIQSHVEGV